MAAMEKGPAVKVAIVPLPTPDGRIAVPLSLIPVSSAAQSLPTSVPVQSVVVTTAATSSQPPVVGIDDQQTTGIAAWSCVQAVLLNNNSSSSDKKGLSGSPVAGSAVVLAHPVLISPPASGSLPQAGTAIVSLSPVLPASDREIRPKPAASSDGGNLTAVDHSNPPPPPLIPQIPVTVSSLRDVTNGVTMSSSSCDAAALPALTAVSTASPVETAAETAAPASRMENGIVDNELAGENGIESRDDDEALIEDVPIDFDPMSMMEWKNGVGTLPDSNLKFRLDESGGLEMVDDEEAARIQREYEEKPLITNGTTSPHGAPAEEESRTCVKCGKTGLLKNFIRAGKFCGQDCATAQATQLKSLAKSLEQESASADLSRKIRVEPSGKTAGLKTDGRGRHMDLVIGRRSPQSEKRKQQHILREESPQPKSRKSAEDENHNSENRGRQQRPDSLMSGKLKNRFVKKSRAKELRNEETTSLIDSEKLSLPSSPSSSLVHITPQSALHQSIFSMRVLQHQQEPPLGWDKHSKNLHPVLQGIKPPDVLRWDPDKVAAFVNTIPGCRDIGQTFAEELIDGEAFLLLNQQDIVKVLNIKLGPAVKIYNSVVLIRDAMEL